MESYKILPTDINKIDKYEHLIPQIQAITQYETNLIANMGNVIALLKEQFNWLWIGFYLVDETQNNLVLGPFQGPLACTRIGYDKGVCGNAWAQAKTLIVPNVHEYPGHIACSSASNSEIVLPLLDKMGKCIGVLDIDSSDFNTFDEVDAQYLAQIVHILMEPTP